MTELHKAIMNLQAPEKTRAELDGAPKGFYLLGFRDARHAAAELALASPPVAVQEEGDATKVLKDLRWRLGDIRDMLMKQNHLGDSIYGCDEWSTPTVNLATAIGVIDKAIAAMKGDKP